MQHLDPRLSSPARLPLQPQQYPDQVQQQAYSPVVQQSPNTSYVQTPNYYANQPVHDSPDTGSPGGLPLQNPDDLKRPRACEACRSLKVKCEIDDNSPNGQCKRCLKAHRQCIITLPSRKRQKKTDSRVAELEKKIDALTAALGERGHTASDPSLDPAIAHPQYQHRTSVYDQQWNGASAPHPSTMSPRSPSSPKQIAGTKRKSVDTYGPFGGDLPRPSQSLKRESSAGPTHLGVNDTRQSRASSEPPLRDLIDRGLIDAKTAYKCFDRYHKDMCHRLPTVAFPLDIKAEDIRRTKPMLFHAIVAVASGTIRPDLQSKLISDATRILAERIVYSGEKSLELVQTIQIMTVFYQPPERYEELNFNQLIHIAAVMALDIGMGKRTKKVMAHLKGYMDRSRVLPDPNAAETRRCWLGCYYMCSK